jgi:hypothetical protein
LAIDLFTWWTISISWSIVFLIGAGFYLYASSRHKRKEEISEVTEQKMNDKHSVVAPAHRLHFRLDPSGPSFLLHILCPTGHGHASSSRLRIGKHRCGSPFSRLLSQIQRQNSAGSQTELIIIVRFNPDTNEVLMQTSDPKRWKSSW